VDASCPFMYVYQLLVLVQCIWHWCY